jgi:hypothetical protein
LEERSLSGLQLRRFPFKTVFFFGYQLVFGSHHQMACQPLLEGAFPSSISGLTGSLRIGPKCGQDHPWAAKLIEGDF